MSGPDMSGGRPEPRHTSTPPSGAEYAGAGLQLALTLVVFMFLGLWLDKRLGSSPWFLIIGVVIGAVGGFYSLYRRLMTANRTGGGSRRPLR